MTAKQQAQLDRHEKQIEDLYKDVREIKNMNLKFMSMGKGLIIAFVVFQGASYGVLSIIRPTVISGLLGRNDFGIISGLLAVGFVLGSALAPLFGSLVWQLGGYDLVIFVALLLPAFSLVLMIAAWRLKP